MAPWNGPNEPMTSFTACSISWPVGGSWRPATTIRRPSSWPATDDDNSAEIAGGHQTVTRPSLTTSSRPLCIGAPATINKRRHKHLPDQHQS